MTTLETLADGSIIVSTFDGSMWHRESFKNSSDFFIWAHVNGIEIADTMHLSGL